MHINNITLFQNIDFTSFINNANLLIVADESLVFWIKKAFPDLTVSYCEKDTIIDYLNNPINCKHTDCEIYSKKNVKILLIETEAKKLNIIDESKVFILKEMNSLKTCLEFTDVFEEASYIIEHMKHYSTYCIASNNKTLNNILLAMNPKLSSTEMQEYINNYDIYIFTQIMKMLLGLNRDYENTELLKLYKLNESYISILHIESEENMITVWNKHLALVREFKILKADYIEKINFLIIQHYQKDDSIISNNKDYYDLVVHILKSNNIAVSMVKKQCIIPFEAIPWLKADHLHIASFANEFGESDRLLCSLNSQYKTCVISYHCAEQLNICNISNMKIKTQNKEKKEISNVKVSYEFPDINVELIPTVLKSYDIAKGNNDVMSFYTKCILNLKSVNYSIEEYLFKHICKIILQYLESFNEYVIEEYFNKINIPLLDKLKIKSKIPNIISRVNDYFQGKNLKVYNSFIQANLHLTNHSLNLISYYDMLFFNEGSAVIVKLVNDYDMSKSSVAYLKHYYSNVLILTFSKALKKYNITNIEFCFIGINDLFTVDLSKISLYDLEYKIHCQTYAITKPTQESINYSLENNILTLQKARASCFLNIMRSYDNMG